MTPTRQATQKCAEWLATCIRLGWRKEDLDLLEALWWKYHDERGNLVGCASVANERSESSATLPSAAHE